MAEFASDAPLCVALSGGMDSVVLLHCLVQQSRFSSLRAIHVNHQLSDNADLWQRQCETDCAGLGIPLHCIQIDVRADLGDKGEGVENIARNLRYQAFENSIAADETLLLAHHADDQYETLLLRLMRGAGVHGLAAIPARRALGQGNLFRPLLAVHRSELLEYAKTARLNWVEDESNEDVQFDRNFCRHRVLPLLATRWPRYRSSLAKSMQLLSEADELVRALAEIDLADVATSHDSILNLAALQLLPQVRVRNTIRYWLLSLGLGDVGWSKLNTVVDTLDRSRQNTRTLIETSEFRLIAHGGKLYALSPKRALPEQKIRWALADKECVLPDNGCLRLSTSVNVPAMAIDRARIDEVQIRYRKGGEELKLPGRPRKSLKKLLQESELEPWLRERLPLMFVADQLVFVPEIGVAEGYAADAVKGERITVQWLRPNFNFSVSEKSN